MWLVILLLLLAIFGGVAVSKLFWIVVLILAVLYLAGGSRSGRWY